MKNRMKIIGIHSYHILCNPKYKDAFQYISVKDRQENDDDFFENQHSRNSSVSSLSFDFDKIEQKVQNDLVKMALEFPFMSKR